MLCCVCLFVFVYTCVSCVSQACKSNFCIIVYFERAKQIMWGLRDGHDTESLSHVISLFFFFTDDNLCLYSQSVWNSLPLIIPTACWWVYVFLLVNYQQPTTSGFFINQFSKEIMCLNGEKEGYGQRSNDWIGQSGYKLWQL